MAHDVNANLHAVIAKTAEGKIVPMGYQQRTAYFKEEARDVLEAPFNKMNWTDQQFIDLITKIWRNMLEKHQDDMPRGVVDVINFRISGLSDFDYHRKRYTATQNKGFDRYRHIDTYTNLLWAWIWMIPIGAVPPPSMLKKVGAKTALAFRDFVATANGLEPILTDEMLGQNLKKRPADEQLTGKAKSARSKTTSCREKYRVHPDAILPSIEHDPVRYSTTTPRPSQVESGLFQIKVEPGLVESKDCDARIEEWRRNMLRVAADLSGGDLATEDIEPARYKDPDEITVVEGDMLSMAQYLTRHFENRMEQQRYALESSIREAKLCNKSAFETIINQSARHMNTLVSAIKHEERRNSVSLATPQSRTTVNRALQAVIAVEESKDESPGDHNEPVKSIFG